MQLLNRDDKCRQNARVISSVSQLNLRGVWRARSPWCGPAARYIGNGVSDRQEMAW